MFRHERQYLLLVMFAVAMCVVVNAAALETDLAMAITISFVIYVEVWWTLFILSPLPSEACLAWSREAAQVAAIATFVLLVLLHTGVSPGKKGDYPHCSDSL